MGTVTVGIVGASGYTGVELLRLAAGHPDLEVVYATGDSQAGERAEALYPNLTLAYPGLVFQSFDAEEVAGLDLVFLGLPHEASMAMAPTLHRRVGCLVDLSAAFRLRTRRSTRRGTGSSTRPPRSSRRRSTGCPSCTARS